MAKLVGLQNIAVDLDDTILEMDWARWQREGMSYFGDPKPGVIKALKKLRAAGFRIIIHTCRTNIELNPEYDSEGLKCMIAAALVKRGVPFDDIWTGEGKPIAPFYVDDRAIEFKGNWREIVDRILNSAGLEE